MYFNNQIPNQPKQMSCKNCSSTLVNYSLFCNQCGAKIVNDRITIKNISADAFQNIFGWDNRFFLTFRKLITAPQILIGEYLNGTRKKYINPFTFLGIGSAIAIFVFNFFADDFLALQVDSNKQTIEMTSKIMSSRFGSDFDVESFKKDQLKLITKMNTLTLKYFNILVLLLIPIYTFIAKLVYRKPYNYAEHLVINSFIQGITFWAMTFIFVISIYTSPTIYLLSIFFSIFFYTYAYGKLYNLTIAESILKIFLFIAILLGTIIALFILSFVFGYIFAALFS
ncbi:uncharacterized protein DUF3667 [Maribacter spongiicola]|uniref:Uncharacterized protein DUF3667 n=1 Tax=Maribacter spongiicola TaxID=1206753 RepID=A0A4R7JVH4_9FLAO|nr:uncharacterized protein DUF3667 [Maribacter spongiicola]